MPARHQSSYSIQYIRHTKHNGSRQAQALVRQNTYTTISSVINNEEERVPSHTSLWRHWLRSCWISMMWMYATSPSVYSCLPPPSESGWIYSSDTNRYTIDWESPELQNEIKSNLEFLIKGCVTPGVICDCLLRQPIDTQYNIYTKNSTK